MNEQVLAAPLQVASRKRKLANAFVAALAGAAIAASVLIANRADSPARSSATEISGPGFTIAYPAGWRTVPAANLPDGATAMLRRADGKGAVVIRPKAKPRDQSLRSLTRDLSAGLGRRFADFRFVSSRVTRTRAGSAFLYTFVRTRQKTAQSIALVKAGRAHFTLDGVAAAGDARAAREVAAIVRSFGP